jgi:ComF family protein
MFFYEGTLRESFLRYKFGGLSFYGRTYGQWLSTVIRAKLSGEFDAVTWVPISKKRLRRRGFDQSRYLAASLCVDWHTAPVETLHKVADNPPQSGAADAAARRANVLGMYEATAAAAGKRWLLVDDVVTTGSTLTECAKTLRLAGAAEVVCATLARAGEL